MESTEDVPVAKDAAKDLLCSFLKMNIVHKSSQNENHSESTAGSIQSTTDKNVICSCRSPSGKITPGIITENDDGTHTASIYVTEPGLYVIDMSLDGNATSGSPFSVEVLQKTNKEKVFFYGSGLESGLIDKVIGYFRIDTKGAGPGDLEVRVHGPKGIKVRICQDNGRTLNVGYNPVSCGIYTINVLWCGEHVAGSPCEIYLAQDSFHLEKWNNNPEGIREEERIFNYNKAVAQD